MLAKLCLTWWQKFHVDFQQSLKWVTYNHASITLSQVFFRYFFLWNAKSLMLEAHDYLLLLKDRIFFCDCWFRRIWVVLHLLFQNRSFMVKNFLNFGEAWKHIHTTEENRDKINITKRKNSLQMSQWYLSCHSRTVCHFWITNQDNLWKVFYYWLTS